MSASGTAVEESSNQSVFAHHKRDVCEGPVGVAPRPQGCSAMGPQRLLYLARGWGHKVRTPCVALLGRLPHVLQLERHPSSLLLFKGAGSEGGGVLSCWKAELKGPHPGDSQETGQGHTETSSWGEEPLLSSPADCLLFGRPWHPLSPSLLGVIRTLAGPTPFLLHTSGFGLFNPGSRPRAYL